jgi:phenylalanyl-tRNA synthetase alpha chain
MELPDAQVAVLEAASADEPRRIDQLAVETDRKPETVTGAAFALEEEGLVTVETRERDEYELTAEGERYCEGDLPEVALYRAAVEAGAADDPVSIGELTDAAGLAGETVQVALANFARKGYGHIDAGDVSADGDADPDGDGEAAALDAVIAGEAAEGDADVLDRLVSRGLLERREVTDRLVSLTGDGVTALMEGVETVEAVDRLTPELLTSGEWRDVAFAEYNVEAAGAEPSPGREHVLRRIIGQVTEALVGMGFQEMDGPHADADFWIHDCLWMPQDHPARTHWDRFALSEPAHVDRLPADLVERVRQAHYHGAGEDGEGYHGEWDEEFARALALRGHTTSLSTRHLSGHQVGDLEPPQRYFSVEKAYRNDTLDATHLLEFYQVEGWVMAEELSVRELMGTFDEFYRKFGITGIEYKPHYNPYTEPSFELFATHPETGEQMEIGNSGMFRQEMLEPLGVDCDVMAWGLALERLAMLITGAEDIRDIHGTLADIEFLRTAEVTY